MAKREPSIRLHPKYGVNPTMPVCFWCGDETGELALLGAAYKGEAPMRMVIGFEPCEKCLSQQARGITLIRVSTTPLADGVPDIARGAYPTGDWVVVREEFIRRVLEPEVADQICRRRRAILTDETWLAIGLDKATELVEGDDE